MNKYSIEQINVSDNEYKIITLDNELMNVNKGDLIFSYESSKTNYDVLAEETGHVYFNPNIKLGEEYIIGTLVAVVTKEKLSEQEIKNLFSFNEKKEPAVGSLAGDIVITKKAQTLINKFQIDLSNFKNLSIITEEVVLAHVKTKQFGHEFQDVQYYYNNEVRNFFKNVPKKLAIIGAGKAALQVVDAVIASNSHTIVFFYDSNLSLENKTLLNLPVKITMDPLQMLKDYENGLFDEIIVSFSGNITGRKEIFDEIVKVGIPIANVIHPSAIISHYTLLGKGNLIFANARIGPFAAIGDNNVISSYCSLEHHNLLGSNNTFGPSVIFSGSCTIGDSNRFGTGIFIEPNVKIGSNCIISSGIVLNSNVADSTLVRNLNKNEFRKI